MTGRSILASLVFVIVVLDRHGIVAVSWVRPVPEGEVTFLEGAEAALGSEGAGWTAQEGRLDPV